MSPGHLLSCLVQATQGHVCLQPADSCLLLMPLLPQHLALCFFPLPYRGAEGLLGSMVYGKRRAVSPGLKAMVNAELPMNLVSAGDGVHTERELLA